MITKRIIPCLDVKDGRVVKGVNFAGLQDMADPVEMARYYNAAGADELVFYDICLLNQQKLHHSTYLYSHVLKDTMLLKEYDFHPSLF